MIQRIFTDISRNVTGELSLHSRPEVKGWRWEKGIVLFPEAICPFCKVAIASKAIWMVDAEANRLIGQVVPVAGRVPVLSRPDHPHTSSGSGSICLGTASSALQALFVGLNPNSVYSDMCSWLRGAYWEHDCSEMAAWEHNEYFYECYHCEEEFDSRRRERHDYREGSFLCSRCYEEHYTYCCSCENTIPLESDDEVTVVSVDGDLYCKSCYDSLYTECTYCSRHLTLSRSTIYESPEGNSYCETCFYDRIFICNSCEGTFPADDNDGDGYCENCSPNNQVEEDE